MKLLIADDHDMFRDALSVFFKQEKGIDVVFARDVRTTIDVLERRGSFDLVLLDYCMPGMNGLEGLVKILHICGDARVAIISGVAPADIVKRAIVLGAAGFLPKTLPARTLVNALHFIANGETYLPLEVFTETAHAPNSYSERLVFTETELKVLRSLAAGKTNKEIANDLQLNDSAIKLHLKRIFRKIRVRNRTEAAIYAKERGYIS